MAEERSWVFKQSGVIPFRNGKNGLQVLLVTSRGGKKWVIPKGIIEAGLTSEQSALKEALEEAGIEGDVVGKSVGTYAYKKWGGICNVEVFLMTVDTMHDEWDEDFRKRKWYSAEDAAQAVMLPDLAELIEKTPKAVKKLGQNS